MKHLKPIWSDKLSNVSQVGGIETSVLDNGTGRGVRIAWFNTGSGLRFKVVIDRAMDIADAFYNQFGLAWLNHPGITPPQPFSHAGIEWLRTFGGGLMTTCGLSHVGGPEKDEYGERGLHGLVSNIPAEIESIIQPDPSSGKYEMSITGVIKQTQIFGPSLELRRTISAILGKSSIHIHDEIINRGNQSAPHMLLYHCNLGWPLVDEGAKILLKGKKPDLSENNPIQSCPGTLESHNGSGEDAIFVNTASDIHGNCLSGIYNEDIGIALVLKYKKDQLPYTTNWQHWSKGEYVCGLEPGTNPPIGQAKARAENKLIFISPGEKKEYNLTFELLDNEMNIKSLINEL